MADSSKIAAGAEKALVNGKQIKSIKQFIPYIALAGVIVFFQITSDGRLLTAKSMTDLINAIFYIGLGASALLFLMSQGNIDLSLGSIVAFSGAVGALAYKINPLLILPAALLTGVGFGFINGLLVAKFRVPSFIATLSMSFILSGAAKVLLGGNIGIAFEVNKYDTFALKIPVLIAVFVVSFILFEYTRFGKNCRAVGAQPEAARQNGVNMAATRAIPFIIVGAMMGVVAFFSLSRTSTASPSSGAGFEFDVLIALMVGGLPMSGGWTVKFRSVIIGCIIMAVLSVGMSLMGLDVYLQQLVKGIIFILSVMLTYDRRAANASLT